MKINLVEGTALPCYSLGSGDATFIYLALSAEESLALEPYNQPATLLSTFPFKIFSLTLPGHEENLDKHKAIQLWAERLKSGQNVISEFLSQAMESIEFLIKKGEINPNNMAIGGLSRGAFLATHLAAKEKRFSYLLGFAPLTYLPYAKEFENIKVPESLALTSLTDELGHLKGLRFYISNYDTRVGTENCYQFIKKMAETVHQKRLRECHVEMRITSPIGYQGHGTSPEIFEEGALWLKERML